MLIRYAFTQPFTLVKLLIVTLLTRLAYFATPIAVAILIDNILISKNYHALYIIVVLISLSLTVSNFGNYYLSFLHSYYIRNVEKCASLYLLDRYLSTSKATTPQIEYGSLLSTLTNDVSKYFSFISISMFNIPFDIMLASMAFIILLKFGSSIVIAMLLIGIVGTLLSQLLTLKLQELSQKVQVAKGALNQYLNSMINGLFAIKTSTTYEVAEKRFHRHSLVELLRSSTLNLKSANTMFSNHFSASLADVIIVIFVVQLILTNKATVGDLVMLLVVGKYIQAPFIHYRTVERALKTSSGSHKSLKRLLALQVVSQKDTLSYPKIDNPSPIIAKGLWFSYQNSDSPVLKGLNLRVNSGESIGIVGKSGAGKTTFINLILGFYKPDKGSISLGNCNISECSISNLRKQIGIVPQNPYIFNKSVRENILLGRKISEDKFAEILTLAGLNAITSKLPEGVGTRIGEDGYTLSGGQIKRIAIARALVNEPEIVILDEATSELDSESEQSIKLALNELMQNRTVIVIAHRLSTIRNLDRIYLLDHGKIAASGKHSELLSSSNKYRALFENQIKGYSDVE